jgi:hypothetical protein
MGVRLTLAENWNWIRASWAAVWTLIGRSDDRRGSEPVVAFSWDGLGIVAVSSGLFLCGISIGQHFGRGGNAAIASTFYWFSLSFLVFIPAFRATRPNLARSERLTVLVLLGLSMYLVKVVFSPLGFTFFDEFLHWRTALDVLELRTLFATNSLLPISPLYPGLELVTVALCGLTGASLFVSALILIAVTRVIIVCCCFWAMERASGSARIAAVGTAAFMGNSSFMNFHAQYAYESLAFMMFLFLVAVLIGLEKPGNRRTWRDCCVVLLTFLALTLTHHLTSYIAAAAAVMMAAMLSMRPIKSQPRMVAITISIVAAGFPIAWAWLISAPVGDYLGPQILKASAQLSDLVSGAGSGRKLFIAADGSSPPLILQALGFGSVILVVLGVALGFFRALTLGEPNDLPPNVPWWSWRSTGAVVLALVAAAYPFTILMRLLSAGWEISNRLGAFVSIGAGFVLATALMRTSLLRRMMERYGALGLLLMVIIVGGVMNGWGADAVRTRYMSGNDGQSVEPLGIAVAEWVRQLLGEENRFAADRTNGMLLSTYGRQVVSSTLFGDPSVSDLYYSHQLGKQELDTIYSDALDFIIVDLRVVGAIPRVNHFYEPGDVAQNGGISPLSVDLLKFDSSPDIDRIMDAGPIIIYDVRRVGRLRPGL